MLSSQIDEALALARQCRDRAYAPYSGFTVGAAVVTQTGEMFGGANVENASYGLTICAERAAAVSAIAAGHRRFAGIVIAGPPQASAVPCGACRQFLSEFDPQFAIAYTTPAGVQVTDLQHLFPQAFELKPQ